MHLNYIVLNIQDTVFNIFPFDPNVAASPYINLPSSTYNNCRAIVMLPKNPDQDRLIHKVLDNPQACTDVLAYIWAAVFNVAPQVVTLTSPLSPNSRLYKHLKEKSKCYQYWFTLFMQALGDPITCTVCNPPNMLC